MNLNWTPIIEMRNHPHGNYLCLVNKVGEDPWVMDAYFTYEDLPEGGRQTVLHEDSPEGIVAFLVPRYLLDGEYEYARNIENKIKQLKKDKQKPAQKFYRLVRYIQGLSKEPKK